MASAEVGLGHVAQERQPRTPEQIRADLDRTRFEMDRTLNELSERMDQIFSSTRTWFYWLSGGLALGLTGIVLYREISRRRQRKNWVTRIRRDFQFRR